LEPETIAGLEALLAAGGDQDRTPLAWLREWPEAPGQKNLVGLVERLQAVRKLDIGPDREQRIHRARYAAIAKETAILSRPAFLAVRHDASIGYPGDFCTRDGSDPHGGGDRVLPSLSFSGSKKPISAFVE
jgi:hypothetical protein